MTSLELKAHAKINIGLQIKNQRPDGYHNIHTVFQEVALHDTIKIRKQQAGFNITTDWPGIPIDKTNTCAKAYLALKEIFPGLGGISLTISKKIPPGAGLGGGSSDAAAVLKGINQLYNLSIGKIELVEIAAKIGADVPFFISGGAQIGDGVGDLLTPIYKPINGFYLLVMPDIFISTAWAYKTIKKHLNNKIDRPNFANFFERSKLSKTIFDNDFEKIVVPAYPEIGAIMDELKSNGAFFASLSGSGSTVYGIFDDEAKAKRAESIFQKQYRAVLTQPTNI